MPLICTFREEWPEWLGGILCLDKYVAIAVSVDQRRGGGGGGGERRQHEEERMWPPLVVVKNRQLQSIWSAERAEWWTEYFFGRNSTVDRSIDPWTRSRYQSGQSQLIKRFSCCTTNHRWRSFRCQRYDYDRFYLLFLLLEGQPASTQNDRQRID